MRGRRPIPTALHLARGTFRKSRHGDRIDAPGQPADVTRSARTPSELSEAEQVARRDEISEMRKALYGEAGPPDPGPRSGGAGTVRRIRW